MVNFATQLASCDSIQYEMEIMTDKVTLGMSRKCVCMFYCSAIDCVDAKLCLIYHGM